MYQRQSKTLKEVWNLELKEPSRDICRLYMLQHVIGDSGMEDLIARVQFVPDTGEVRDWIVQVQDLYTEFTKKFTPSMPALVSALRGNPNGPLTSLTIGKMFFIWLVDNVRDSIELSTFDSYYSKRCSDTVSKLLLEVIDGELVEKDLFSYKNIPIEYKVDIVSAMREGLVSFLSLKATANDMLFHAMEEEYDYGEAKYKSTIQELKSENKKLKEASKFVKTTVKYVGVRDTHVEDELYQEVVMLRNRVLNLEDKVARYELAVSDEEYEVLDSLYMEQQDTVDISGYKILIAGSDNNKSAYPFNYVDLNSNIKLVGKFDYVDYAFFDTRTNSHHVYYTVKSRCKKHNVPLFHINCRNKDLMLSEAKRLIASCKR